MTDTILSLENIKKSFDGENVLKNISLDIGRGEFITLGFKWLRKNHYDKNNCSA